MIIAAWVRMRGRMAAGFVQPRLVGGRVACLAQYGCAVVQTTQQCELRPCCGPGVAGLNGVQRNSQRPANMGRWPSANSQPCHPIVAAPATGPSRQGRLRAVAVARASVAARARTRRRRETGLRHWRLCGGGGGHPPGLARPPGGRAHARRPPAHRMAARRSPRADGRPRTIRFEGEIEL